MGGKPKGQLETVFDRESLVVKKMLRILESLSPTGRYAVLGRVQAAVTSAREAEMREQGGNPLEGQGPIS